LGTSFTQHYKDRVMSKELMSVEEAARALVEYAQGTSLDDFALIAAIMLEDASPGEVAAIGVHLPEALRRRLPQRTSH
jgi:hypothetical protein